MGKQLVKIVREICEEEKIAYSDYSSEYIMKLESNHRVMYIFGNRFPNNNAGTEQICNDKSALSSILEDFDIPHVPHFYFDSPTHEEYYPPDGIWNSLEKLLFRYHGLVCKVNNGTGGNNVFRVLTQQQLESSVLKIFKASNSMAVSPLLDIEEEYRVLMIGGELQYAFRKIRPEVVGDGIHTVQELYDMSQYANSNLNFDDIDFSFVPNVNQKFNLIWKHNLGQGAQPEFITSPKLLSELTSIAEKCVAALDLGFVSIDIVKVDGELMVLEINSGVMIEHLSAYSAEYYQIVKRAIKKAIKQYLHLDTKYELTKYQKSHYVLPVITKIAKERNINIIEDMQEHNFAIFSFENGNCFVARDYPFNINYGGTSALCQNKSACNGFIKALGFSVPMEKYYVKRSNLQITLNEIEKEIQESTLGFSYPIVIKPNDRAQGEGVFVARNKDEVLRYTEAAFSKSKLVLLQEYCEGNEYRIVVLNGKILQAYQRIPFYVQGDGRSNIHQLIAQKVLSFKEYGRDKEVNAEDSRVLKHIVDAGYTETTILPFGEVLRLQDIANLSLGGESRDTIDIMDRKYSDMAISLAHSFNLKLCGIDIIANDISDFSAGYHILEINSAPGLDNYLYPKERQEHYVEELYRKVFDEIQLLAK